MGENRKELKFATRYVLIPLNHYEGLVTRSSQRINDNPLLKPELARSRQVRSELTREIGEDDHLSYEKILEQSQKLESYLSDLRKLREDGTRSLSSSLPKQPPLSKQSPSSLPRPAKPRFQTPTIYLKRPFEQKDEEEEYGSPDRKSVRDESDDPFADSFPRSYFSPRSPSPTYHHSSPRDLFQQLKERGYVNKQGNVIGKRTAYSFSGKNLNTALQDAVNSESENQFTSDVQLKRFKELLREAEIPTKRFPDLSSDISKPRSTASKLSTPSRRVAKKGKTAKKDKQKGGGKNIKGKNKYSSIISKWVRAYK